MRNEHIYIIVLMLFVTVSGHAKNNKQDAVLARIFSYAATIDTSTASGTHSYAYTKGVLRVEKRNALLMPVPTMYAVAHGGARSYLTETYNKISCLAYDKYTSERLLELTTIPHRKQAMEVSLLYLTPEIYNVTILGTAILSPFNRENKIFYKYRIKDWHNGRALVIAKPKLNNTQLIGATAFVNTKTGQIIEVDLQGEYDMVSMHLSISMGDEGVKSLHPQIIHLTTRFSLLGNKITGDYTALYNLQQAPPDSIIDRADTTLMANVRPIELNNEEKNILARYLTSKTQTSTKTKKKPSKAKAILWDAIGENLVQRVKSEFGSSGQGSLRISPLLAPEVLGYSRRKGITYKMDLRLGYRFNHDMDFAVRAKLGYSFKQHQLYYNIPATFFWSHRHNAYTQFELSNGNHIRSYTLEDEQRAEHPDTINWQQFDLHTYKDYRLRVSTNYDFCRHVSLEAGFITHKRTAVSKQSFDHFLLPHSYRSVAPLAQLSLRPLGHNGPVIAIDYERSFKGLFEADIDYERWEIDGQWLLPLRHLKSLSMRLGTGFYTQKGHSWQFLDYANFRENNLINGWDDDWSGEFELLDSEVYNTSPYYIRSNLTYSSPLLALSWLPLAGHFIEMERIYASVLKVKSLDFYMETGYGFTTRAFSLGVFVSNRNGHFAEVGAKLSLELFHNW